MKSMLSMACVLALSYSIAAQCTATRTSPLSEKIPEFIVTDATLLTALLQLGQIAHVPIGIEYVDRRALTVPVSIKLGAGTSLEQGLSQLLSQQSGYSWTTDSGVVVIKNAVAHNFPTLLDQILPAFDLPRTTTLQQANALLYMDLKLVLDPSIKGFAGEYNPDGIRETIAPVRLSNVTVRSVLNYLVRCDGSAAWIVHAQVEKMAQLPKSGTLWVVVPYDERHGYDVVKDQLIPSFPE